MTTDTSNTAFYRRLLAEHGDNAAGVGWNASDADVRYRVMLEAIRPGEGRCSLLDFGCGTGHLLEYIRRHDIRGIDYHGLDVSAEAIALCHAKFPGESFQCGDVLAGDAADLPMYDYIVLNGVFTYRGEIAHDVLWDHCRTLLRRLFPHARKGLALNFMSKQVDWERDDLFHVPLDTVLGFLSRELSRHVVFRHDYGLYEYTACVYRDPSDPAMAHAKGTVDGAAP